MYPLGTEMAYAEEKDVFEHALQMRSISLNLLDGRCSLLRVNYTFEVKPFRFLRLIRDFIFYVPNFGIIRPTSIPQAVH